MAFTINKTKAALNAKSKSHKKLTGHKVSLAAMAATAPKDLLGEMKLERRPIKSLKGLKRRVRKTEAAQLERVTNSLRTHRQKVPILIDASGEIINGHIIAQALEKLGADEAWCVITDNLDEHERELLHVTLNRIGETGDWDIEALGPLLIEFDELGYDLGVTGFTLPELDIIMTTGGEAGENEDDIIPPLPRVAVTLPNDLWKLGKYHRVLCADSTDPISYTIVLNGELVDVVFTDSPWNIPIEGFVSGHGKTKHKDFKMGAGELSDEDFAAFLNLFHQLCANHLAEGAAFYSCIDWRSVDLIMAAGKLAGLRHANTIIWNKGSGANGTPYRSAHELIVMFVKGKLAVNNVEMGKHGRDRTNVWSYPGANQPGSSASKALQYHPTPKPIEMVEDALKDVSKRGALVLDVFLGSGTTLLAAERSGRRACCIELDPAYVDVAIRRWEAMTGKEAVHAVSGKTFAQMASERNPPAQKHAA